LTDNSHLQQKLKDEHHAAMMQKQKELNNIRHEAADIEKQLEGCIEVIGYLHKMLLGGFCSMNLVYPL
jgi:hypothetical protein